MKTPQMTAEYNALDLRYQELRELLAKKSDSNLIQEICDNVRRRREIAIEIFGQPTTKPHE